MKYLRNIIVLTLAVGTLTCGTKLPYQQEFKADDALLVSDFDNYKDAASVNIENVQLEKDLISIFVTYSGGCEKHEFSLLGLYAVEKSLPPGRRVMLFHNGNGDSCRELISDTLRYNILPFMHEPGKEIKLLLEGWPDPIMYTPTSK